MKDNVIRFPLGKANENLEPIVGQGTIDLFKPLNVEECRCVRTRFYDLGHSVRSIARMLRRAESLIEQTMRDLHRDTIARYENALSMLRPRAEVIPISRRICGRTEKGVAA